MLLWVSLMSFGRSISGQSWGETRAKIDLMKAQTKALEEISIPQVITLIVLSVTICILLWVMYTMRKMKKEHHSRSSS